MKHYLASLALALALPLLLSAQSKMPAVVVQTMDGKKVNPSTWTNGGKPIIVNFWATWCAPCKRELSAIADKYDTWQLDPNGDLKRALNVNNVPHTFLLDGKGNIVWQHNNYEPGDENDLYEQVKKAAGK